MKIRSFSENFIEFYRVLIASIGTLYNTSGYSIRKMFLLAVRLSCSEIILRIINVIIINKVVYYFLLQTKVWSKSSAYSRLNLNLNDSYCPRHDKIPVCCFRYSLFRCSSFIEFKELVYSTTGRCSGFILYFLSTVFIKNAVS